ncbi:Outer membrane lipoprotein-sorting protein [Nakamurella panacisegetis]|uniref:Outer membrane lipoprotein-sorting protein n=1 Tax=Nakamurella panacisegetis TaxID=1090615 RepID=A0A1H0KKV1_9ACTN|nr:hypothetical protein [Nakamurella panacisegetis]SDO56525.1 Outer membrane lipoprotein-sorting protein [Nakamurella panacisegetis]
MNRSALFRWAAPVAVAAVLVGGTLTVHAVAQSAGSGSLPPRTAAQLLVDLEQAKLTALSGTVVQSSDLGLPNLPDLSGGTSADLTSLITGTHTLRVWYDGPQKARLALLGRLGESDVIRNGADLWIWSSQSNTATHRALSSASSSGTRSDGTGLFGLATGSAVPTDPQQAADAALAAITPTTVVTPDATASVAGHAAYQLTLAPRVAGSLISSIRLAIDGTTHIPLRVQVFAAGQSTPAFEVAYTSVTFSAPDAAEFTFDPPPGAKVTQDTGASPGVIRRSTGGSTPTPRVAPRVVGSGWTSVLVTSTDSMPSGGTLGRMLAALPKVSGSWGSGHLLAGTAFSLLIADDGRVAVGAVDPAVLYRALATR